MKFFSVVTSGLIVANHAQYTTLTYCNADSYSGFSNGGLNWVLLGDLGPSENDVKLYIGPTMCQSLSYGKDYSRFFRYHVCNNTVWNAHDNDPRCHPTMSSSVGYGGYIGDLNISVDITYTGNKLQANFTPYEVYAKNMTMMTCQTHPSYYNIYINTTKNIPSCIFSDDDPFGDDSLSDDSTDDHSSKKEHTLTMQDKVLIGIFAGGFGVCICGVLCFLTLEKICGWGVVPNHSDQREEPRVITRNPVVQDTVPASHGKRI